MGWCIGNHSYAKVVEEEGPRKGALLSVGKWAKVVIFECQGKVQDWGIVGKALARMMVSRARKIGNERRNSFVFEEMISNRKYSGSWTIQEALDRIMGSSIPSMG